MIFKLFLKKILKSNFKFVFLIKKFKKKTNVTFLKLFLNVMIKKITIQNIFNIIKILKSMKHNKCTQF